MTLLLLALAHAQTTDPASWAKSEGDLSDLAPRPEITCCGYAPHLWRQMFAEVSPHLAACAPRRLKRDLRVSTLVVVLKDTGQIDAQVDSGRRELDVCLEAALETIVWPGEPLKCGSIRISYPVVFAAPKLPEEALEPR